MANTLSFDRVVLPAPLAALGQQDLPARAPAPTLVARLGFHAATVHIPAPALAASLAQAQYTTVALLAPALSLASAGVSGVIGVITGVLPAPVLVSTSVAPARITAALTSRSGRLLSAVLSENRATAVLAAVAPIMAAVGYPAYTITTALVLPAPRTQAALGAAVATAYRTWVLNTRKHALTEYGPEFAFNSFASFNGQNLACGPGGIVVLGLQGLDNSTPITAMLRTGQESFASSFHKRVPRIYTSGNFSGDMLFRTITTEGGTRTYSLPFNGITGIQQRRVPVGKGPKSRLWQFEVENVNGCDFGQNDMLIYTTLLRRRVQ